MGAWTGERCCQLIGSEVVFSPRDRALWPCSGRTLGARDLLPRLKSLLASGAIIGGSHPVTAWPEEVVDERMYREKALRLTGGLETAHLAFLLPRRLV